METSLNNKISVLIPVYGEDDYLDECIRSVVNQTYRNLEIILVDDGSPDKCPAICDEWAKKDDRIKVIHKENGGLVSARQVGMQAASGDYIAYVDGDDWIEADMYEHMISEMELNKADIVVAGFKKDLFGKTITCNNGIAPGKYDEKGIEEAIIPCMMCETDTFQCAVYTYVWNKLFRREVIYDHQMRVDTRIVIGEDAACVYPAILDAEIIVFSDYAGYHYRHRMDSLLRKAEADNQRAVKLQIFKQYLFDIFKNSKYKEIMLKQLYFFYVNHLLLMSDNLVKSYPELGEAFPFVTMPINGKIIIYSAGAYGIHVYNQFWENKNYDIVAWVDPDYEQYIGYDDRIISLEESLLKEFDICIIASTNFKYIRQTKEILLKNGVSIKKIVSVEENMRKSIELLQKIGILDYEAQYGK